MLDQVQGSLSRGAVADAVQSAEQLMAEGALREAMVAYSAIAEAAPSERAYCTGRMGDIHVQLGEYPQAYYAYQAAASMGAPVEWVHERLAWLNGVASAASEVYISPGGFEASWGSNQNGAVVVRRNYVAFLPTESATHIASIAAKIVAAGAVGGTWVRLGRPKSPQEMVQRLRSIPSHELDAVVPTAAREIGGLCWCRGEAYYQEQTLPLGMRLFFARGKERLHVGFHKNALSSPVFVRLANGWRPPSA